MAWGNKPSQHEETLKVLKSIDARLANIEGCVRTGVKHKPDVKHIVTSHWND